MPNGDDGGLLFDHQEEFMAKGTSQRKEKKKPKGGAKKS